MIDLLWSALEFSALRVEIEVSLTVRRKIHPCLANLPVYHLDASALQFLSDRNEVTVGRNEHCYVVSTIPG